MKISGRQLLAVEESVIRSSLADPHALRTIIPGCESVEPAGPDEYRVWINLRVGMITDRYTGLLKFKTPAGCQDLEFLADGESPNGLVYCRGRIILEAGDDGETAVCYEAEIDVGGRITTLSPRLLETTARSFARRCLEGLDKQVSRQTRIYTTTISTLERASVSTSFAERVTHLRRPFALVFLPLSIYLIFRGIKRSQTREIARQLAREASF
jgi:uncharacterized protein